MFQFSAQSRPVSAVFKDLRIDLHGHGGYAAVLNKNTWPNPAGPRLPGYKERSDETHLSAQ